MTGSTISCVVLCFSKLWQTEYSSMRFIEQPKFNGMHALELVAFQTVCMRGLEAAKTRLLSTWFPETQRIFYNAYKKKLIPTMSTLVRCLGRPLIEIEPRRRGT